MSTGPVPPVHVRFFVRALPRSVQGPARYWSDQGYAYLRALAQAQVPLCAATTYRGGTDLGDAKSYWYELARCFSQPVATRYVNVVCGDNGDVHHLYTVGVPNIAITGVNPRHPTTDELVSLSHYDEVFCPTEDDAAALRRLGITKAAYVPPTADRYVTTVRRYADEQARLAAS